MTILITSLAIGILISCTLLGFYISNKECAQGRSRQEYDDAVFIYIIAALCTSFTIFMIGYIVLNGGS